MATIGKTALNAQWGLTLSGTEDNDEIYGYGGDDTLFGGLGNDSIYGGLDNDEIYAGDGNYITTKYWGHDTVRGGPGDDFIDYRNNQSTSWLWGDDGNDEIWSGPATDILHGGNGDDALMGGDAPDYLYGDDGVDELWGGNGEDFLYGGGGADWLHGGGGPDHFDFSYTPSGRQTYSVVDTIGDFNSWQDTIDGPVAATASNYKEITASYNAGYGDALAWAYTQINSEVDYAFISDGVNGYLFGDLNSDGWMDTGMVLNGLTSVQQFAPWCIS